MPTREDVEAAVKAYRETIQRQKKTQEAAKKAAS